MLDKEKRYNMKLNQIIKLIDLFVVDYLADDEGYFIHTEYIENGYKIAEKILKKFGINKPIQRSER